MDLYKLWAIARRHWLLMSLAILAGLLTSFTTLYRYDPDAPANERLQKRSYTVYKSDMQLLVVDPEFAVGRAGGDPTQLDMFGKTVQLAQSYASFVTSDVVRKAADQEVGGFAGGIEAIPVQNAPIIQVTLTSKNPEEAEAYGLVLTESLEMFLAAEQEERGVPEKERVTVRLLTAPSAAAPIQSRQWEMGLIAFLVPVAGAYSVALLRHSLSEGKRNSELDDAVL